MNVVCAVQLSKVLFGKGSGQSLDAHVVDELTFSSSKSLFYIYYVASAVKRYSI